MPHSASSEQGLHCLHMSPKQVSGLTLLHSERPKLYTILAYLSAIGLKSDNNTGYKRVRQFTLPAETVRHVWQEAESHGQSLQEAIFRGRYGQEARDHGQSQWKPNMTDSLCRKRKLADTFIPCE